MKLVNLRYLSVKVIVSFGDRINNHG